MIRGISSATAGTCCWSWPTAGRLSARGMRIGALSVGTDASALLSPLGALDDRLGDRP